MALRDIMPLSTVASLTWLFLTWLFFAPFLLALWLLAGIMVRRPVLSTEARWWRIVLVAGLVGFWIVLGTARAAWADPTSDPHAITHFASGNKIIVQGQVNAEPDLRSSYRLLTVEVS